MPSDTVTSDGTVMSMIGSPSEASVLIANTSRGSSG